jgi:hypothetical protein
MMWRSKIQPEVVLADKNAGRDEGSQELVHDGSSAFSKLYYAARIYLHKKRWLLRSSQVARGFWVLGPLRPHAIRYYQRVRHNSPLPVETEEIFPKLNVDRVVHDINEQGFSQVGEIPANYVAQIVNYCECTKRVEYWNPHKECEAIRRLAYNDQIVQIARRYLGTEPILWLTQLRWSVGNPADKQKMLPSVHPEPVQYDCDAFHYDTLDFKSVTVFIYLTDVVPDSGPHVAIGGTHKTKTFSELCHIILSDERAEKKFGDRINMILGPKGTVLFEETSSFHKAARCKTKRLMLSMDYVLQRTPPPERPRFTTA